MVRYIACSIWASKTENGMNNKERKKKMRVENNSSAHSTRHTIATMMFKVAGLKQPTFLLLMVYTQHATLDPKQSDEKQ